MIVVSRFFLAFVIFLIMIVESTPAVAMINNIKKFYDMSFLMLFSMIKIESAILSQ